MLNSQKVDALHVSGKVVIARSPRAVWPIFSRFCCCYFVQIKAREISGQNIKKNWKILVTL